MKKLKLDLESVHVESFDVSPEGAGRSTIHGYAELIAAAEPTNSPSCPTNGCGTCYETCWDSCEYTCVGTTGKTETEWNSCKGDICYWWTDLTIAGAEPGKV